jgi:hypothetical protein
LPVKSVSPPPSRFTQRPTNSAGIEPEAFDLFDLTPEGSLRFLLPSRVAAVLLLPFSSSLATSIPTPMIATRRMTNIPPNTAALPTAIKIPFALFVITATPK